MAKTMRHALFLIPLVLACAGCQNEARWYPEAEVSIGNQSEYTDAAGAKRLAVTVIVHNTSSTSILSSTVTLRVVTDRREYLQTVGSTNKIVPDGTVALPVSVAYLEPDESLQPDGTAVCDSFFD